MFVGNPKPSNSADDRTTCDSACEIVPSPFASVTARSITPSPVKSHPPDTTRPPKSASEIPDAPTRNVAWFVPDAPSVRT